MTYFEIVNRIKDIVFRHKMLVDFGYGNLSDIKTVAENEADSGSDGADYPYVFVNPQNHQRTGQSISYRFNLIVMDQAKNAFEVLKVQSDCQQYIDDIISELRFDYKDAADVILNFSLSPFKERFQDTVAGMTASLEIQVADNINNCIAPFSKLLETLDPVIGLRNYNSNSVGTRRMFNSWAVPEEQASYRFTGYVDIILQEALTDDAAPYDVPYMVWLQDADNPRFIVEKPFDGTLVGQPQRITFDYTFTLEDVPPDNNDVAFCFGYSTGSGFYPDQSTTITTYDDAVQVTGGELKIYKS